jgi:hypothetical protein
LQVISLPAFSARNACSSAAVQVCLCAATVPFAFKALQVLQLLLSSETFLQDSKKMVNRKMVANALMVLKMFIANALMVNKVFMPSKFYI